MAKPPSSPELESLRTAKAQLEIISNTPEALIAPHGATYAIAAGFYAIAIQMCRIADIMEKKR